MTQPAIRLRSLRALGARASFFVGLRGALSLGGAVSLGAHLVGCSHPSDEPANQRATSTPAVAPLQYTVPSTWEKTESSDTKERRAGFKVSRAGDDKEDGEALVLFFGTGSAGDRDKIWDDWFAQFDGNPKADAKRADFEGTHGLKVETWQFLGNYKLNMGPHKRGMTKSPVQMVKNGFRMLSAVVHTPDRGNWFFRLVGPDQTVQAAAPDFKAMLDSAQ